MTRIFRQVDVDSWPISDALQLRRSRLMAPPDPASLLRKVQSEAASAVNAHKLEVSWQESCDFPGYFRLVAVVPLEEDTFDQLFNGRSGYRAQYYLSPEEGILFNRDVLSALAPSIERAYAAALLEVEWVIVQKSLEGPHAKIWIFEEKVAFDSALRDALNPPRWVNNGATTGRKAPLPSHRAIEIKGAFIDPSTLDLRVDELKLDRPCEIFNKGYT